MSCSTPLGTCSRCFVWQLPLEHLERLAFISLGQKADGEEITHIKGCGRGWGSVGKVGQDLVLEAFNYETY